MAKQDKKNIKSEKTDKPVVEVETKKPTSVLNESTEEKKPAVKKMVSAEIKSARAFLRNLRISPKKVRLVINEIRNIHVNEAISKLSVMKKGSAGDVLKLLNSAIANAVNNFKLNKDDLYVITALVNEGPTLHRFRPAAFGSAHAVRKRTSKVEIVVGLKKDEKKSAIKQSESKTDKKTLKSVNKKSKVKTAKSA